MQHLPITLMIIFSLCAYCAKGQVIVIKELSGDGEFPEAETHQPNEWFAFLTNKDYDTIPHIYNDGYFYIQVPESYAKGKDTIRISTIGRTYKFTGNLNRDTLHAGTVYYLSNNHFRDVWHKYDDYEYYQELYAKEKTEYNSDSTCYCKGMYKGKQQDNDERFNFSFYKSGTWECYNTLNRFIAQYNYGALGDYEGSFYAEFKDQNLKIEGQHKKGAQIGEWIVTENGKESRQSFSDRDVVIVVR